MRSAAMLAHGARQQQRGGAIVMLSRCDPTLSRRAANGCTAARCRVRMISSAPPPLPEGVAAGTAADGAAAAPPGFRSRRNLALQIAAGSLFAVAGTFAAVTYIGYARQRDLEEVRAIPLYEGNPVVFLDIVDHNRPLGRLIIQLRADVTPIAAQNFLALCTAPLGYGYKASPLHGLEKGSRVFGGDFFGGGSGAYTIFGQGLPDESYALQHIGAGCVGLRNYGPNAQSSQFYITQRRLPHLDGVCEVIGHVTEGFPLLSVLDKAGKTTGGFTSEHDFRVAACGELPTYRADVPRLPSPFRAAAVVSG